MPRSLACDRLIEVSNGMPEGPWGTATKIRGGVSARLVSAVPFLKRVRGSPASRAVRSMAATKPGLRQHVSGLARAGRRFNWPWKRKRKLRSRRYCQGKKLCLGREAKSPVERTSRHTDNEKTLAPFFYELLECHPPPPSASIAQGKWNYKTPAADQVPPSSGLELFSLHFFDA